MDIKTLASQISSLSDDDAAKLLDALGDLSVRATKAKEERSRAEAERDAKTLTCGCGKPVAVYRWLECVQHSIRPDVWRRSDGLKGGYVADSNTYESGVSVPSEDPVYKRAWFKCGNGACAIWTQIEGGENKHVIGWE